MKIYQMPQDYTETCNCQGNARRDGRNLSVAIATSAGYGRSTTLRAFEGLQSRYCEQCQWKFKAGFFEEKQRLEEQPSNIRMEAANGR